MLLDFFIQLLYGGEFLKLKISKKFLLNYYKQLKNYKKTINYLYLHKSKIKYILLMNKRKRISKS